MKRLRVPAATPARARWREAAWVAVGILLTAVMAQGALGQEPEARTPFDLVGTVTDPGGEPLVGAFVSLIDSDWGSLTTETGRFRIPTVTPGPVALTVELIGYETATWTGRVAAGEAVSFTLTPEPVVLEGLTVVGDRFETRRRATATTVRWFDRSDLATSPQDNVVDFVAIRAGLARMPCRGEWTNQCFLVRGRVTEPSIWIDEMPVMGGMDYLRSVPPNELYMVEVYGSGRHIRAYTNHFMERAAKTRLRPMPFVF